MLKEVVDKLTVDELTKYYLIDSKISNKNVFYGKLVYFKWKIGLKLKNVNTKNEDQLFFLNKINKNIIS